MFSEGFPRKRPIVFGHRYVRIYFREMRVAAMTENREDRGQVGRGHGRSNGAFLFADGASIFARSSRVSLRRFRLKDGPTFANAVSDACDCGTARSSGAAAAEETRRREMQKRGKKLKTCAAAGIGGNNREKNHLSHLITP